MKQKEIQLRKCCLPMKYLYDLGIWFELLTGYTVEFVKYLGAGQY